jgi:hypothetical protein
MALYSDGQTQAKVGDMVVGKPHWTQEEQCGKIVALRETEQHNAVVAYVDNVSLDGVLKRRGPGFAEQHLVMIRPFDNSPTMVLRILFEPCHTSMFNRISGPLYDIMIDEREFRVPWRMKVIDLLGLVNRDKRFILYRRCGGQDARYEHDVVLDIAAGYEFYTTLES